LPFATWGTDILWPLPKATIQRKFLLVAIDYFTKGVEAEAVALITGRRVKRSFGKNIITRFGVPRAMVFDNDRQFDTNKLRDYFADYGIKPRFTAVARPQTNKQVESANKQILNGKGLWEDELPGILWSIRITEKSATGETPFVLVYGSEAVLPIEVAIDTHRVVTF